MRMASVHVITVMIISGIGKELPATLSLEALGGLPTAKSKPKELEREPIYQLLSREAREPEFGFPAAT